MNVLSVNVIYATEYTVRGHHHGNPLMCHGVYVPITSLCCGQWGIYGRIPCCYGNGQKRNDTTAQGCSTATEGNVILGYNAEWPWHKIDIYRVPITTVCMVDIIYI